MVAFTTFPLKLLCCFLTLFTLLLSYLFLQMKFSVHNWSLCNLDLPGFWPGTGTDKAAWPLQTLFRIVSVNKLVSLMRILYGADKFRFTLTLNLHFACCLLCCLLQLRHYLQALRCKSDYLLWSVNMFMQRPGRWCSLCLREQCYGRWCAAALNWTLLDNARLLLAVSGHHGLAPSGRLLESVECWWMLPLYMFHSAAVLAVQSAVLTLSSVLLVLWSVRLVLWSVLVLLSVLPMLRLFCFMLSSIFLSHVLVSPSHTLVYLSLALVHPSQALICPSHALVCFNILWSVFLLMLWSVCPFLVLVCPSLSFMSPSLTVICPSCALVCHITCITEPNTCFWLCSVCCAVLLVYNYYRKCTVHTMTNSTVYYTQYRPRSDIWSVIYFFFIQWPTLFWELDRLWWGCWPTLHTIESMVGARVTVRSEHQVQSEVVRGKMNFSPVQLIPAEDTSSPYISVLTKGLCQLVQTNIPQKIYLSHTFHFCP